MSNFVMSLPSKDQYYCDKINTQDYNIVFTKKEYGSRVNFLRKINIFLIKKHLLPIFSKSICKKVYDLKIVDAIINDTGLAIIDAYVNYDLLYLIKKFKPKKTFLLIWNPLNDETAEKYKRFINIENIYSYSQDECEKYGFKKFNDFYLIDYPYTKKEIKRDFYFLGHDKNRMELMEKFIGIIKNDYSYKFDIFTAYLDDSKKNNPLFDYFTKYKPFSEYLDNVFESNCLIDFNTTHNITFRTLESLIFKKKYISNNVALKKMDFYNPNNMLIVDENTTLNDIKSFMDLPYVEIDRNILENYSVYTIYNEFKKKCEEI